MSFYTAATAQVGLEQRLTQVSAEDVNIFSHTNLQFADGSAASSWAAYDRLAKEQLDLTVGTIGNWLAAVITWGESAPMFVVHDGSDIPNLRVRLVTYDHLASSQAHRLVIDQRLTTVTV
ncbi:MAG: hypothetical protein ACOCX5_04480 [Chloroflexota bacterium]